MKLSIVIIIYNTEHRYVREALESIASSTLRNVEICMVDDGSSLDYGELAREFGARLYKQKNGGMVAARMAGINMATGDYIAFLDSDDMWLPDKLERQLPLFDKYAKVAVVFSNYEKVNEYGERAARVVVAPRRVSYRRLLLGNVIGNVTGIYDTKRVGKVYFPQVRHEDYAMWLSILKRGYLAYNLGEVTALYRVSFNSVSSRKLHLLSWQWKIYRNVEKLNFFTSVYYYANYAVRAFIKSLI